MRNMLSIPLFYDMTREQFTPIVNHSDWKNARSLAFRDRRAEYGTTLPGTKRAHYVQIQNRSLAENDPIWRLNHTGQTSHSPSCDIRLPVNFSHHMLLASECEINSVAA